MIPGDTLGERARWARETAGLSVAQAAWRVSVPVRCLQELEANLDEAGMMRIHLLAHLPGVYGVRPEWLSRGQRGEVKPETRAALAARVTDAGDLEELLYMLSVIDG
jgi:hypothetical protein